MSNTNIAAKGKGTANPLGTEPVGALMRAYAIPSVISLVVNSLYNMVDQVFIGQGVGYLGNAATNVIMPLMTFGMAISLLFGDGTAAYMSLKFGIGQTKDASKGVGNTVSLTLIVGIIYMVLVSIFLEPLCWLFGATQENISYCLGYGSIVALGFPAAFVATAYGSIIRADGRPKINMAGLLLGTVINLICDPLFIFVFKWGVQGAAFATILGQYANAIFNVFWMFRLKTVQMEKRYLKPNYSVTRAVLPLGTSSCINQLATVIVIIVSNNLLVLYGSKSVYGADIPLAVFGIVMKVSALFNSIFIGIASGCQPIWGFNYGSGQFSRVKECFKNGLIVAEVISLVGLFLFQVFPDKIILIFGAESDLYIEFAVKCFRIYLLCCFMIPCGTVIGILFQALGKPGRAIILSLLRQFILLIPALIVFSAFGGIDGLLWAGPFSDLASGIASIVTLAVSWKKLFPEQIEESRNKRTIENQGKQ